MALNIIKNILLEDEQARKNIDFYFYEINKQLQDIVAELGVNYHYLPIKRKRMEIVHSFFNFKYIKECCSFLKKTPNKNIIVVQGDIQQGSGFLVAAKFVGVNLTSYIPFAHSFKKMNAPGYKIKDPLAKICYKLCNNYITISDSFIKSIREYNPKAQVSVIRNFVPAPKEKQSKYKDSSSDFVDLYIVGRVQFMHKGHDILINALSGIKDEKINLHVIGDGPDFEELKSLVEKLPANINVKFYGWLADCWEHSINADAIVIPSRFEGVPLIMLEALAREIPIIAVARDGMVDYLSEESLYLPGDNEILSLRNKIVNFTSDYRKQKHVSRE